MTTIFYQPQWDKGRGIYAESRLAELRTLFNDSDLIRWELRRHELEELVPTYRGWTPNVDFENADFQLEGEIELLTIGQKVPKGSFSIPGQYQIGRGGIKKVTSEELAYGRNHAGSPEVLQEKRENIDQIINRLNADNIPFIVFRTYRGWPAVWDTVYFYSIGNFKDEPFRMPLRLIR